LPQLGFPRRLAMKNAFLLIGDENHKICLHERNLA
jgi:hypothetical protein